MKVNQQTSNFDHSVSSFAGHKTVPGSNIPMNVMLLLKVATALGDIKSYLDLL